MRVSAGYPVMIFKGNIWNYLNHGIIVVPTNGSVKRNGECVMGRGIAAQCASMWPDLPSRLGTQIRKSGNHAYHFTKPSVVSFPVKRAWYEKADLDLIKRSNDEIIDLFSGSADLAAIYVPQVGCGNGGRTWEEVEPLLTCLNYPNFHLVLR